MHSSLITQAVFPLEQMTGQQKGKSTLLFLSSASLTSSSEQTEACEAVAPRGQHSSPCLVKCLVGNPAAEAPPFLCLGHWRPHTGYLRGTEANFHQWPLGGEGGTWVGEAYPQTSPSSLRTPASTFFREARGAPALESRVRLAAERRPPRAPASVSSASKAASFPPTPTSQLNLPIGEGVWKYMITHVSR